MRKRYLITMSETVQGRLLDFYYAGGKYSFHSNIANAKGYYSKDKADAMLEELNAYNGWNRKYKMVLV